MRVVRGWVECPRGASAALPHVILIHGFKGFMDWGFFPELSRRIVGRNMVAVRFNMSGSGVGEDLEHFTDREAFARNTVSRELEDLGRVREWLAGAPPATVAVSGEGASATALRAIDPGRAALLGHSRGGALALLQAAERADCRAVVTWSAVADLDRFDEPTKAAWSRDGHVLIHNQRTGEDLRIDRAALEDLQANRERFDVEAACARIVTPTLLVHGEADETVPVGEFDRLAAALRPRIRETLRIPGAGHTFGVRHPMESAPASFELAVAASLAMVERHTR
jgi:pimeloyl-ACP methyl ester carboxylesterase